MNIDIKTPLQVSLLKSTGLFIWCWMGCLFSGFGCVSTLSNHPIVDHFDIQGHRGARGLAPENTIPAFKESLNTDGANSLAVDLFNSKPCNI